MRTVIVAVGAATLAAALYALSSALQHRTTADVQLVDDQGRRSFLRFAHRTVRHPSWLLGTLASVAAVVLHALALHDGPLALVQPVMISGVVFALPLRSWLDGRPVARGEVAWAAILAAALAGFLILATPSSAVTLSADRLPAIAVAVVVVGSAVACLWAGRKARGPRPALLLGAAAGLAFAASAALLKTTTDIAGNHGSGLFSSWPVYALVLVGITGLAINQLAFQSGPLRWSLPAVSTMDPLASLLIGIVVYDEQLRGGLIVLAGEVLLLAIIVVSTVALTRGEADPHPLPAAHQPAPAGKAA